MRELIRVLCMYSVLTSSNMSRRARILVVGSGGIGTIAALNLHVGGACHVTMVLRSSYQKVLENGFSIDSFDHGKLEGWKPDSILPGVPSVSTDDQAQWFDLVVCATKNLPDASPTLQIIKPAITPGHTNIVLLQNGLNIETTFLQHFPTNMILSGISYTSSHETSSGVIVQSHPDDLIIGAFAHHDNHNLSGGNETARTFVDLYGIAGKTNCTFTQCTQRERWRKLIYNATFNPVCAILNADTGDLRQWQAIDDLVRPAMQEIVSVANVKGYTFTANIVDETIAMDEACGASRPSMSYDVAKGNLIEVEILLGEVVREGDECDVPVPTLRCLYHLCKAIQLRTLHKHQTKDMISS
ncbi:2-dehydropantoate 2-reductase family protein [Aureobasidium pullulans]|nr:2-dehydropantoate 2-reductase family protein [Aureobasidium pullulans]